MAIIDELGLEANILVNGLESTEYIPDEDEELEGDGFDPSTKRCYRYVESIDDAHFPIRLGLTSKKKVGRKWIEISRDHALRMELSFDGRKMMTGTHIRQGYEVRTLKSVVDGMNGMKRKFWFSPVTTGGHTYIFEP